MSLKTAIEGVINTHSGENGSNTPDWILAEYLTSCLKAFDEASNAREKWYGVKHEPGFSTAAEAP